MVRDLPAAAVVVGADHRRRRRCPTALRRTDYDRTLALLAVTRRPVRGAGAGRRPGSPTRPFSFVADNQAKGISAAPARHAARQPGLVAGVVGRATGRGPRRAAPARRGRGWVDASVVESQLKRWRFATPQAHLARALLVVEDAAAPLVLAGDAFAGPRVEGAALSGLAAAAAPDDGSTEA